MPELLDPKQAQTTLVALPGAAARPVPQGGGQAQAPPSPFRPVAAGPKVLLLPHEEAEDQPVRQSRADAVRLEAQITPVRLGSDEVAFWRHIRANPDDKAPRLIFADRLREIGADALAEVVARAAHAPERYHWYQVEPGADPRGRNWTHYADLAHPGNMTAKVNIWSEVGGGRPIGGNIFVRCEEMPGDIDGVAHLATTDLGLIRRVLEEGKASAPFMEGYRTLALDHIRGAMGGDGPERFAAQAPPGGLVVRGLMHAPGQFVPKEALESHPAPTKPAPRRPSPTRSRLQSAIRRKRGSA